MIDEKEKEREGTPDGNILGEEGFLQTAESLRLQGEYVQAIRILNEGLGKRPDCLPGRLLLGRCFLEHGMIPEAKVQLESVARVLEECLPVYKMLSQVYIQEKDVDRALEVLRKTLYFPEEGGPKRMTPLELGLLQRSRPPFAAPPIMTTGAPSSPPPDPSPKEKTDPAKEPEGKAPIHTDTLAEIYLKQGHLDRALSVYEEILTREPENTVIREKRDSLQKRVEKENGRSEARKKVQAELEGWLSNLSSRKEPPSPGN